MTDVPTLAPFLGAVFDHVDGDPVYVTEDGAPTELALHTTLNEPLGIAMRFRKKADALSAAEQLEPSLVITGPNESATLVYLVTGNLDEVETLVSDLNQDESDDFYADMAIPLPTGDYSLSDYDNEVIASFEVLPTFSVNELDAAFFPALSIEESDELYDEGLSADVQTTLNDATIYGEIPADVLSLPIKISTGANQEEKVWKTTPEFPFGDLLSSTLTKHTVGKKNGLCFVTGSVADKRRIKNSILGLYLLGLDVDSGASLDETFAKVQAMGLTAVFYTTHSHLTTRMTIKQDPFFKWAATNGHEGADPSTELVRLFLEHEGKYVQSVIDSAEYEETVHEGTGLQLIVSTRPIDKFRIVFPLAKPYIIAEQRMAQRDAIIHWERMIMGMGAILGIQVDRAARDPSRLFFLPRHDKGRPFKIMVAAGKALDWTLIQGVDAKEKEKVTSDPFDQAAAIMGGRIKGRPMSPTKGIDLMTWAKERSDGFEISSVFRDYCDDRLRGETASGKYTCECPFDDEHSNSGDPEDKGCFIQDAGIDSDTFNFRCSHDSCAGRDRLNMLEKALNDGWFPDDVLTDDNYDVIDRDETVKVVNEETKESVEEPKHKSTVADYDRAFKLADAAQQGITSEAVEAILKMCIDLSSFDKGRVLGHLAGKIKVPVAQLNNLFKSVEQRESGNRTIEDTVYDPEKLAAETRNRFQSLKSSKKPILIIDETQQTPTVTQAIKVVSTVNRGRRGSRKETREGVEIIPEQPGLHELFRYGDNKVRVSKSDDGLYKPEVLTKEIIMSLAHNHLQVIKIADSNAVEPIVMPEWVAKMVVVDPSLSLLKLDGFADLPYYNARRELVTKAGYNEFSHKILKMQDDVAALLTDKEKALIKYTPTMDDVDEALNELFDYCFVDFPFYDGEEIENGRSSRAHLLCMMLHPIVRDLIAGPTPLYLVDKPAAGTGASLMVSSAMMIATGTTMGTTMMSENDEELRKAITANYAASKTVMFIDNVNTKLDSGFFANLATAEVWEDRILGQSNITSIKNTMQCIFAGNNVEASEENMRRMLLIKLDFKDDPTAADREFVVENLKEHVAENKTDLYARLLTLVNYWISKGAVAWEGKPLTGFEAYCRIMGGILEACEVEGFLENRNASSSANSPDRLAWSGFIQEMISKIGFDKYVSMSEIVMTYVQMTNQPMLYVNGGGRVTPSDDESRTYAPMQRVIDRQLNQVFRVYYKGEEIKVTIKKVIDKEKSTSGYGIERVEGHAHRKAA